MAEQNPAGSGPNWPYPSSGWQAAPGQWGGPAPYPAAWGSTPWYAAPPIPPGPEPGLQWGGIGARFGALIVDAIIILASLFALGLALSAFAPSEGTTDQSTPMGTALAAGWFLLVMAYHPVFWYVFGGTPGQKALGIRIAQASNGEALGLSGVIVRYLIFALVTVAFPLGLISAYFTSEDPFKRAWHDQVARSIVVRRA